MSEGVAADILELENPVAVGALVGDRLDLEGDPISAEIVVAVRDERPAHPIVGVGRRSMEPLSPLTLVVPQRLQSVS